VRDFTADPHTAIAVNHEVRSATWSSGRAKPAQSALLAIGREIRPTTLAEVRRLEMPTHHDVRQADVNQRRLGVVLALSRARGQRLRPFLLLEQLGRARCSCSRWWRRWSTVRDPVQDPARFAFAHGGKDGHPFRYAEGVTNQSRFSGERSNASKLGHTEKLHDWRGSIRSRGWSGGGCRRPPTSTSRSRTKGPVAIRWATNRV